VHVDDVARIFLEAHDEVANVAAETISVGDIAALAEGRPTTAPRRGRSRARTRTSTASPTTSARAAPREAAGHRRHRLPRLAHDGPAARARPRDRRPRPPGHRPAPPLRTSTVTEADAGAPSARDLVAGCDAVLHFAGVPDPAGARADPARAVRENAGTTLNLLEACAEHGAGLVYPSSTRAATAPDPYGMSKRLGEEACRLHAARATSVRMTSIFGPGQNAWEGATGAIAAFAARALDGRPITIPGNPRRTRDFLYVDDFVDGLERHVAAGEWPDSSTRAAARPRRSRTRRAWSSRRRAARPRSG
jgi:hypothetical protein